MASRGLLAVLTGLPAIGIHPSEHTITIALAIKVTSQIFRPWGLHNCDDGNYFNTKVFAFVLANDMQGLSKLAKN